MTRGQDSLVIDAAQPAQRGAVAAGGASDLSQWALPVLLATPDELAAHDALMAQMAKASGGKIVWPGAVAA